MLIYILSWDWNKEKLLNYLCASVSYKIFPSNSTFSILDEQKKISLLLLDLDLDLVTLILIILWRWGIILPLQQIQDYFSE